MSTPTVSVTDQLREHIIGVRRVIDWLDEHPDLPLSIRVIGTGKMHAYLFGDEFAPAVRALKAGAPIGTVRKSEDDDYSRVTRDFGGVTVELYTRRDEVCELVVVGTEPDEVDVPACPECGGVVEETPTGFLTCRDHGSDHYRAKPLGTTKVVVGEREITEWKCSPILADRQDEEVAV